MKSKFLTLVSVIPALALVSPLHAQDHHHHNVIVVNDVALTLDPDNGLYTFNDDLSQPFYYGPDRTETIILNLADPVTLDSEINYEFGLGDISPSVQTGDEAYNFTVDLRDVDDHTVLEDSGPFGYAVTNDFYIAPGDPLGPINNESTSTSEDIPAGTYDQIVLKINMTPLAPDPSAESFTIGVGDFLPVSQGVPDTGTSLVLFGLAVGGLFAAAGCKGLRPARALLR